MPDITVSVLDIYEFLELTIENVMMVEEYLEEEYLVNTQLNAMYYLQCA